MKTVASHALELEALSLSESADRVTIALEQAALFPARLALARLTSGAGLTHLHDAAGAHAPLRAAWLEDAQRHHQAWLDKGGFTQYDEASQPECAEPPAPNTDAQQDNACVD